MVTKITQKEYKKIRYAQKHSIAAKATGIVMMRCADNKYYRSDVVGIMGVKELNEWNKKLKDQLNGQTALL